MFIWTNKGRTHEAAKERKMINYSRPSVISGAGRAAPLLLLLLIVSSCGEATKRVTFRPGTLAQRQAMSEAKADDGILRCQLEHVRDPKAEFGYDLTDDIRVVAVRLRAEFWASENEKVSLQNMKPVLFLEDGTALTEWDLDRLLSEIDKDHRAKVNGSRFEEKRLRFGAGDVTSFTEGVLFFHAPRSAADGELVFEVPRGEADYVVDVRRSVLQFEYSWTDEEGNTKKKIFNVGAQ